MMDMESQLKNPDVYKRQDLEALQNSGMGLHRVGIYAGVHKGITPVFSEAGQQLFIDIH